MDGRTAGPRVPAWRVLPARALEALAGARCASVDRSAAADAVTPDPAAVAQLVLGLEVLVTAVGAPGVAFPVEPCPADPHRALVVVADLTATLADAARHVAWTAGFAGQEQAAEVADAIMTTAWALRVLAELGLRVVPAPDGGEPAPPRDPAP